MDKLNYIIKGTKRFLKMWFIPIILFSFLLAFSKTIFTKTASWLSENYYEIQSSNQIPKDTLNQSRNQELDPKLTGRIVDTFGGTMGPIIAIFASFLTFLAFWIQYKANIQQEKYLKQQRFEDTFFRLLDHHKKIVDSIDIRDAKNSASVKATGSECFKNMYSLMKIKNKSKTDFDFIINSYNSMQYHYSHDLDHYFRFLYHILKFIKNSDIPDNDKFKYSSILRASLSAYELVLLFYNCLHKNGISHFKPLVEEFSFLKNLDHTLLINKTQMSLYHSLAFSNSSKRHLLQKDWKEKNK